MNTLKALAKMTKIASRLQDNWDHSLRELATLEEKYDDTVKVATDRDTRIKQLEAELYAAEQKAKQVPPPVYSLAKDLVESLGYSFDHDRGWILPAIAAAPSAPTLDVDWDSNPWANHLLSSCGSQVFAELVEGEYLGAPETDTGHGRLRYYVGLAVADYQVIAVRPGYAGPLTRSAPPPILTTHVPAAECAPIDGRRWCEGGMPPKDKARMVELVFVDGVRHASRSAESVEWGAVAWWRFA